MDKLAQLKKIAEIVNTDKASAREVALVLSKIMAAVKSGMSQIKDELNTKADKKQIESYVDSIRDDIYTLVNKLDKNTKDELYKLVNREVYKLEKLISEIPQYDSTQLENKFSSVIKDIENRIASIKVPEIPKDISGEKIVDKVNDVPIVEEDQIDFKHIKGWKDTIGDFVRTLGLGGRSGGVRSSGMGVYKLVLNGVTKSFTIPNFRGGDIAILGSSFPTAFAKTTDYTVNGSVITFTDEIDASTTLSEGQTVIVLYNQLFFTK